MARKNPVARQSKRQKRTTKRALAEARAKPKKVYDHQAELRSRIIPL